MSGDNIGDDDTLEGINISNDEVSDYIAEYALEGKWREVEEMYKRFPVAHTVMINEAEGTALHVAVDLNEQAVVESLVNAIIMHEKKMVSNFRAKKALEEVDELGNTPLHLAASRGFATICKCIIGENNERKYLMRMKNKAGETPLFLAAVNWRKQAFAYLLHISRETVTLADLVRNNGDSILHCAIQREYLDLAVIIVHYYDFLSTHMNNDEFTPLKVLATRPSAFQSGSYLSWWKQILYHCILVEPVDVERTMNSALRKIERTSASRTLEFPKNYATCCVFYPKSYDFSFTDLLGKVLWRKQWNENDTENPPNYKNQKISTNNGFLPPNYATFQQFVRSAYVHALGLSGVELNAVKKMKKTHKWSGQLLTALLQRPYAAFTGGGGRPTDWTLESEIFNAFVPFSQLEQGEPSRTPEASKEGKELASMSSIDSKMGSTVNRIDSEKGTDAYGKKIDIKESAFLLAARNGIVEMVNEILSRIPSAIHNTNSKKENVLLVAVLSRQPLIVETMRMRMSDQKKEVWNNLLLAVDDDENTMLHLAGQALGGEKPWQIAGSALQMMWDIKWFQYIKSLVPQHFYFRTNKEGKTAGEIFKESHKELVKESGEWLKETSESCSVVAALVAGVSFATASSVPGGTNDEGRPTLEGQPAFDVFAIASLIGLCFSVTGLIMFLSILTSRKQAKDFRRDLPLKLLLGLSSLFVSIAAMFIAFCTGHFFLINHKYKNILFPIYAATCLPVSFYAAAQFPLYMDLFTAILTKVPQASDKGDSL